MSVLAKITGTIAIAMRSAAMSRGLSLVHVTAVTVGLGPAAVTSTIALGMTVVPEAPALMVSIPTPVTVTAGTRPVAAQPPFVKM